MEQIADYQQLLSMSSIETTKTMTEIVTTEVLNNCFWGDSVQLDNMEPYPTTPHKSVLTAMDASLEHPERIVVKSSPTVLAGSRN